LTLFNPQKRGREKGADFGAAGGRDSHKKKKPSQSHDIAKKKKKR